MNDAVREMFRVEEFPDMTFKSTGVKQISEYAADVTGDLMLLGVTKPVTLHVEFNKKGRDPFGSYICGFSATADIKRSEFGMTDYLPTWNQYRISAGPLRPPFASPSSMIVQEIDRCQGIFP